MTIRSALFVLALLAVVNVTIWVGSAPKVTRIRTWNTFDTERSSRDTKILLAHVLPEFEPRLWE